MRWRRLLGAGGIVLTLVAAGCSDDSSGTERTGPTQSVPADQPSVTEAPSGGAVGGPDLSDLTVPLPSYADGVARSESGPLTLVQFIVPLDQQDAAIAFYDEWTATQADEYQRVAAEGGGVSWQNAPDPGADRTLIAILAPLEGDDFVVVTLTTGPLE